MRLFCDVWLDDDLGDISESDRRQGVSNDNFLVWRDEDDYQHEFNRSGGRQGEGFEATPARLGHVRKVYREPRAGLVGHSAERIASTTAATVRVATR